jgi:hypothetical protein
VRAGERENVRAGERADVRAGERADVRAGEREDVRAGEREALFLGASVLCGAMHTAALPALCYCVALCSRSVVGGAVQAEVDAFLLVLPAGCRDIVSCYYVVTVPGPSL